MEEEDEGWGRLDEGKEEEEEEEGGGGADDPVAGEIAIEAAALPDRNRKSRKKRR